MALGHLQGFRFKKSVGIEVCRQAIHDLPQQGCVTTNPSRLQHCRLNGDVFCGLAETLVGLSNTGADFKADVPAVTNEMFDGLAQVGVDIWVSAIWQ